jgi:hypothetical protein
MSTPCWETIIFRLLPGMGKPPSPLGEDFRLLPGMGKPPRL